MAVDIGEPCKHCDHPSFCQNNGCTAWNNEARDLWDRWQQILRDQLRDRLGRRPAYRDEWNW